MKVSAWLAPALLLAGLSAGCVSRRYVITSDPPGAVVYRDGQPIGATPVEEPFVYYGTYSLRLVKDGYEPLDVCPELEAPWYQIPGIDFVAENLVLYKFRDVQRFHYQLQPLQQVRPDDVRRAAEGLRARSPRPPAPVPPPPPAAPGPVTSP